MTGREPGLREAEEDRQLEAAADLLALSGAAEAEPFLAGLLQRAARAAGSPLRPGTARALAALLRRVAAGAIPFSGGPLTAAARPVGRGSRLFGVELEGLSPEDQDLELARRFVRLAETAAAHAARGHPGASPARTAREALAAAARRHAPGLLTPSADQTRKETAMHNLDRTLQILESGTEPEAYDAGEMSMDPEAFEPEADYESDYEGDFEYGYETGFEAAPGAPLSQEEEIQLANELLTISTEEELDQFLGGLFRSIGKGFKSVFRPLGGMLKTVGKKLLPIAGTAVGGVFGGPAGAAVGGKLGSLASNLFEVDLESLEPEVQDMEVARRYVRLASAAARRAAFMRPNVPPRLAARRALFAAARRYAPGLLRAGYARPVRFGYRRFGYAPRFRPYYRPRYYPAPYPVQSTAPYSPYPMQYPYPALAPSPAQPSDYAGMPEESVDTAPGDAPVPGDAALSFSPVPPGPSGRWIRRGNRIILMEV